MTTPGALHDHKTCLHTPESDYLIGNGVRQRGSFPDQEEIPHYFIRPFKDKGGTLSWLESFVREVRWLCQQREAQQTLVLVVVNLAATLLLVSWCHATRSMALMAYTYLSWFSLLSLITCLVYVWAEGQQATSSFTFGYQRCEVLAVFASVMLSLLGAVIIVKECIERFIQPEAVQTGMLSIGGVLGLFLHLGMTSLSRNPPLAQVLRASQSSLLQEHVADMCHSLCNYIPSLTRILLPRVDPLVLISITGFLAILADHLILQIYNYQQADNVAALVIALLTIATMFPLCLCSATILLQTTPPSTFTQLDKCLREALTLDGVLEFRHEKFWALGVEDPSHRTTANRHPSGFMLTGSLHVRIRRDANEQKVLAHVRERLSPLVPLLTVQVFKDDWTRSATTLQLLNDSARALATSPSHSPHYVNVTYPQVYSPLKPTAVNLPLTPSPFLPPRPQPYHTPSPQVEGSSRTPFTDVNRAFMEDRSSCSHSGYSQVNENVAPQEPSESHMHRISGGWSRGVPRESAVKPQTWMVGKEPHIPREGHSPKPSPHYVNVDFSARSGILQNVAGTPVSNCNSSHHVPR
ncbi:hypothetical protein O3P69_005137 [Scylla paramamosain]|uniref:Cation efflux protein transmembrane domain-containing protein n=2 Tax=Scylla paramamosain TaxID=85552 RepID=A0AAW0UB44_SCYPA